MILEGTDLKVSGAVMGVAAVATGLYEILARQSSILGPMTFLAGGILLVALWFGHRIAKVAERLVEDQFQKVVDLPSKAELKADRETLLDRLEHFASSFDDERRETSKFRIQLADTLADHTARLTNLERKL